MALHSRAFLLLRRDLINLNRYPISGISASPDNDNLFHWNAKIHGLAGTDWEGGVFQVKLSFDENFNSRPPEIHFMTVPFHPNVDPNDGSPVIHQLSVGWSEDCSITTILLALQAMLGDPELDSGCIVHEAAAHIYLTAPHTYRQMALDCITASLRIDAGLPPHEGEDEPLEGKPPSLGSGEGRRSTSQSRRGKRRNKAVPISFDDYHALWKGIATSVTSYKQQDEFITLLEKDRHLNQVHSGAARLQHTTIDLQQKLAEHMLLRYGTLHPKNKKAAVKQLPDPKARIEQLKMMYRNATSKESEGDHVEREIEQDSEQTSLKVDISSSLPNQSPPGTGQGGAAAADGTGVGQDDVDGLVQWTRELDEQQLMDT